MNQVMTLATRFVAELRAVLTPEHFIEVCKKNTHYPAGTCASHDYCDANMVMLRAFEDEVGRAMVMDESPIAEADRALWNAAWEYAHATALTARTEVEYEDADGIRVVIQSDDGDQVSFYTAGGGFVRLLPRAKFFEIFKPAGPRQMRRGRVDADWMPEGETLPCWTDGSLWNGWSMPFFPREAVDRLIEQSKGGELFPMRWDGDKVVVTDEDGDYAYTPVTMPDGSQAWDIGAGSWCWNRIQLDEETK